MSTPSFKKVIAFFAAGIVLLAWQWWQSHAAEHPRRHSKRPAEPATLFTP